MPGSWTGIKGTIQNIAAGAAIWLCFFLWSADTKAELCILYDASTPVHHQYASALQKQHPLRQLNEGELNNQNTSNCELIVTLGFNAATKITEHPGAVIHALITRSQFHFLYQKESSHPRGAIYIDQALEHYFALIQTSLPERKNIIFMVSDNTRHLLAELESLSREIDKKLLVIEHNRNIKPGNMLKGIKGEDSILLIIPDSEVLNSDTARSLILTSYQQGIAMIVYSHGLVKSGALMSIYTSLSDMVTETGEMIDLWLNDSALPEPGFTRQFSVAINYNLARALALRLPTENLMKQEIKRVLADD